MAKRFIDTGLFDDSWFMGLTKEAKLLWIYLITKCDHAGIVDVNTKLAEVQVGIKSYLTVSKQLGDRLIHIRDSYYFIPKFIDFQYPDFPKSNVRQQQSAIKILENFGLFSEGKLTVSKDLVKSYGNGSVTEPEPEPKKPDVKKEIPSIDEFVAYAFENDSNLDKQAVELKYKAWKVDGWTTGKDKPILNWKKTLLNTIPYMKKNPAPAHKIMIDTRKPIR